jgi:hypothetical protein
LRLAGPSSIDQALLANQRWQTHVHRRFPQGLRSGGHHAVPGPKLQARPDCTGLFQKYHKLFVNHSQFKDAFASLRNWWLFPNLKAFLRALGNALK